MSATLAIARPPIPATAPAPLGFARCCGGGSDEWQPALVQENGSGGWSVKLSSDSAVGAKWGVWHVSHPHSFSCVQVGHVFGGLGRTPTTDSVDVAWAEAA